MFSVGPPPWSCLYIDLMLMPRSEAGIALFFPIAVEEAPFVLLLGINKLLVCRLTLVDS